MNNWEDNSGTGRHRATDRQTRQTWLQARQKAYLHVGVVGGLQGFVQRRGARALTAVGVVALGMNNPLVPADLLEVHHHVHPAAERPPAGLLGGRRRCRLVVSQADPVHAVPLVASGLHPGHAHVFGAVHGLDQAAGTSAAALGGPLVGGVDDHHDATRDRVLLLPVSPSLCPAPPAGFCILLLLLLLLLLGPAPVLRPGRKDPS